MNAGRKDDQGKPPLDLVPSELRYGAARGYAHGAEKYGRHNWRGGLKWSRLWAAMNRHLQAWWDGEEFDKDSGIHHLDLAASELGMLMQSRVEGLGEDDRPEQEGGLYRLRPYQQLFERRWGCLLEKGPGPSWEKLPNTVRGPDDLTEPWCAWIGRDPTAFEDYYERVE